MLYVSETPERNWMTYDLNLLQEEASFNWNYYFGGRRNSWEIDHKHIVIICYSKNVWSINKGRKKELVSCKDPRPLLTTWIPVAPVAWWIYMYKLDILA